MKRIDRILADSKYMVQRDRERDVAFQAYADQYHNRWNAPEAMRQLEWFREAISTDPSDAMQTGINVMSGGILRVKMQPMGPGPQNQKRADDLEQLLKWNLKEADRRKSEKTLSDVIRTAIVYGATAVQVVDVDWNLRIAKNLSEKRKRIYRQRGRFAINVYNPIDVHSVRTMYGLESVLLIQTRTADSVIRDWGDVNDSLKSMAQGDQLVTYYDYTDLDYRAVFVGPPGNKEPSAIEDMFVIVDPDSDDGEHEMDFIPWAAEMGGAETEHDPENKFHPMGYSLRTGNVWDTMNIVRSLMVSEAISKAAAPETIIISPNPDAVEVEYGDPGKPIRALPGTQIMPYNKQGLDSGLYQLGDMFRGEIEGSTISGSVRGGNIRSGAAFSALNLDVQVAAGQLKPSKELSEKTMSEVFTLMVQWVAYTGVPLVGYEDRDRMMTEVGSEYTLLPDEIDPESVYIECEIDPDLPTDKQQRANTASMMVQWGYPVKWALEDVGVEDTAAAMEQWWYEKWLNHMVNLQQQLEMNAAMSEQQMAIQQQQMEAQMQAQQAELQGPVPGGQGFNPAMGGQPPIEAASPEVMLRESVMEQLGAGPGAGMAV